LLRPERTFELEDILIVITHIPVPKLKIIQLNNTEQYSSCTYTAMKYDYVRKLRCKELE
jgi:hypothetical protein